MTVHCLLSRKKYLCLKNLALQKRKRCSVCLAYLEAMSGVFFIFLVCKMLSALSISSWPWQKWALTMLSYNPSCDQNCPCLYFFLQPHMLLKFQPSRKREGGRDHRGLETADAKKWRKSRPVVENKWVQVKLELLFGCYFVWTTMVYFAKHIQNFCRTPSNIRHMH